MMLFGRMPRLRSPLQKCHTGLTVLLLLGIWAPGTFSWASAANSRVILKPTGKPAVTVATEVVATPWDRERGLMFRQALEPNKGMLFLFPRSTHLSFWMRNTLIPLDMIFITPQKRVLGVVHQALPLTEEPREVPGDSQFVLEVAGGFAKKHGIVEGTSVEFLSVPKPPTE